MPASRPCPPSFEQKTLVRVVPWKLCEDSLSKQRSNQFRFGLLDVREVPAGRSIASGVSYHDDVPSPWHFKYGVDSLVQWPRSSEIVNVDPVPEREGTVRGGDRTKEGADRAIWEKRSKVDLFRDYAILSGGVGCHLPYLGPTPVVRDDEDLEISDLLNLSAVDYLATKLGRSPP